MKKKLRISSEIFTKATTVFEDNGWDIPANTSGFESRFNRFCERISLLEYEEQLFVIELTKRFEAIDSTDYLTIIMNLIDENVEFNEDIISKSTKFIIFPLIAPKDINKTKSSKFVWYLMQNEKILCHKYFVDKDLCYLDINQSSRINNLKPNEIVLLVDDFIGSGETAKKCIDWLVDEYSIGKDRLAIMTLAAQKSGLDFLDERHIRVYTYYCFDKGISNFYSGEQLKKYTELMEKIEKKLDVDKKYNFGYSRSEALVALTRTPNNTFPVFWIKKGKNQIVPFPRY